MMNLTNSHRTDYGWRGLGSYTLMFTVLFLSSTINAQTHNAASCASADIQAAIDAASDGDTVLVPEGSATWTSGVSIPNSKGLTLRGAGADKTVITAAYSLTLDTLPGRAPLRVTGFKFIRTNDVTRIYVLGTATNWRIDHNIFDDVGIKGPYTIEIGVKGNENLDSYNYGVIDNNQFLNRNYGTSVHVSWVRWGSSKLDTVASGDWIWSQPPQRGTEQAVYIEDNVFSGTQQASQVVDTQYGAKVVVRYNTIHNPWISTHSGMTNGGRNCPWTEVYKNTFSDDGNRYGGNQIEMRSTSGIIWGNTSTADLNQFRISIDHERSYRTDGSGPYGGLADGTRAFDENVGLHGYRAFGQPGWGPPQVSDMSACTFAGVFAWDNLNRNSPVQLVIANNNGYTSEHLQAGRELFNASNIGMGPITSRPATCSPNPTRSIYVSTDENAQGATVYVCLTANEWTKHWEPYTYPHPLRMDASTPPAIDIHPENMTVNAGQTATFTVTVTGTIPIAYQWSVNGTVLPGATAASYTTPTTTLADNGTTFSVLVSNAFGSVTSNQATLIVSAPETIAPTVVLNSPVASATLSETVTVTADASDNVGVAGVQFKLDGANLGAEDISAPYEITWDTRNANDGTHTLSVVARDAAGNIGSHEITVTVSNNQSGFFTLWGNDPTPANQIDPDPGAVELGVKFYADLPGQVHGVRFYKGANNIGTHSGSLWKTDGTLLARVTFTNETASGWQQANFAAPVTIEAQTTYVVSYHTTVGKYAAQGGYFNSNAHHNPPLHAPSTEGAGGNGVYNYSATTAFPNKTWNGSNYWVDVVYFVNADPIIDSGPMATPEDVEVGETVAFHVNATDADNDTLTYTWHFNDGTAGNGTDPSHVFAAAGTYVVTVTVADGKGGSDTGTVVVVVNDSTPPPPPPPAEYTITAAAGMGGAISPNGAVTVTEGDSQTFTIAESSGYQIADVMVDGVSQGVTSSYSFPNVTAAHTITASFTLIPVNQKPVAAFTIDASSGVAPLAVNFDASTSSDSDGTIVSYSWIFGDGTSASGVTARYVYSTAGNFTAALTVTDDDGDTSTKTLLITVNSSNNTPGLVRLVARDQFGVDVPGAQIYIRELSTWFSAGTQVQLNVGARYRLKTKVLNATGPEAYHTITATLTEAVVPCWTATLVARDQFGVDVSDATFSARYIDGGSSLTPGTSLTLPKGFKAWVSAKVFNIRGSYKSFIFTDGLTEVNPGYWTVTLAARDQYGTDVANAEIDVRYLEGTPFAPGTQVTLPEGKKVAVRGRVNGASGPYKYFYFQDPLTELDPGFWTTTIRCRDQFGAVVPDGRAHLKYYGTQYYADGAEVTVSKDDVLSTRSRRLGLYATRYDKVTFTDGLDEFKAKFRTVAFKALAADGVTPVSGAEIEIRGSSLPRFANESKQSLPIDDLLRIRVYKDGVKIADVKNVAINATIDTLVVNTSW